MTTLSAVKVAGASIGLSPARHSRNVLVGTRGVLALGVAREAVVLASGKATALRDLRQISLNADQPLSLWDISQLMAAAALFAWLAERSGRRPEA